MNLIGFGVPQPAPRLGLAPYTLGRRLSSATAGLPGSVLHADFDVRER